MEFSPASIVDQGDVRSGSWLRENSEIEFTNGNFLSTSINLENKSAGDGCRDKTIKKTILRALRARTFSRGLGQKAKYSLRADVFRFAPESGLKSDIAPCPKGANNGLMHRSKEHRHSITSSARASSDGGTVRPSALAVFRLITSSNLVGCSTGRSAASRP